MPDALKKTILASTLAALPLLAPAISANVWATPALAQNQNNQPRAGLGKPMVEVEANDEGAGRKILFIGQSILYVNDMPRVFAELLKIKRPQDKVLIEMVAGGGYSLSDHYLDGTALKELHRERWTDVILAESTANLYCGPVPFEKYANLFDTEAHRCGGKALMFECYDESETDDAHSRMHVSAVKVARQLREQLIPVGATWRYVHKYYPLAGIFGPDFHHPSPLGAYLMACVTYSTLYGESAEGAPITIQNPNRITRKTETLNGATSPTMLKLARAAYETAKLYRQ